MEKIITWVADDGTEFETEEECINYENRYKTLEEKVVFISDGKIMKNIILYQKLRDCDVIIVPDAESAKLLHKAFCDESFESPFYDNDDYRSGIFEYNNGWVNIDEELVILQEKKNKILEILKEE